MQKNKLRGNEQKCLAALIELGRESERGMASYFHELSTTGLTLKQIRRAVRSLMRKGFTEYVRGLIDDDGKTAGSGYRVTEAGRRNEL